MGRWTWWMVAGLGATAAALPLVTWAHDEDGREREAHERGEEGREEHERGEEGREEHERGEEGREEHERGEEGREEHERGEEGREEHERDVAIPERTASVGAPSAGARSATATLYTKECGACHVAYPPELLPARSWEALLGGLSDHFGDDAGLPEATRAELAGWLASAAGDVRGRGAVARIPSDQVPLRITELGWFRGEHREVSTAWVADNPEVRTWANCTACHAGAGSGRFGEGEIRIPGHGGWED